MLCVGDLYLERCDPALSLQLQKQVMEGRVAETETAFILIQSTGENDFGVIFWSLNFRLFFIMKTKNIIRCSRVFVESLKGFEASLQSPEQWKPSCGKHLELWWNVYASWAVCTYWFGIALFSCFPRGYSLVTILPTNSATSVSRYAWKRLKCLERDWHSFCVHRPLLVSACSDPWADIPPPSVEKGNEVEA